MSEVAAGKKVKTKLLAERHVYVRFLVRSSVGLFVL